MSGLDQQLIALGAITLFAATALAAFAVPPLALFAALLVRRWAVPIALASPLLWVLAWRAPLSPWTDLACDAPSMRERESLDPMVRPEGLREMAAKYLGGLPARTPLASPLHAALGGLPPLLVQVGTAEGLQIGRAHV